MDINLVYTWTKPKQHSPLLATAYSCFNTYRKYSVILYSKQYNIKYNKIICHHKYCIKHENCAYCIKETLHVLGLITKILMNDGQAIHHIT
jgi:hypothetical protein